MTIFSINSKIPTAGGPKSVKSTATQFMRSFLNICSEFHTENI